MLGKLQYRCLGCNGPTNKLHDAIAEKVARCGVCGGVKLCVPETRI
jgi:hypothetical protein